MAYRHSIIARTKLFYQQQQRLASSFSHISSRDREELPAKTISENFEIRSRFLMSRNNAGNSLLSGNVSRLMRSNIPAGYGIIFRRNLSKVPSNCGDLNGVIGAVADKTVEAAPVVNEVAVAVADSFAPVAAFQYLIDYVHCYTGFQWWAAIAATTLLIRFIQLPLHISELKFLSIYGNHFHQRHQQVGRDLQEVIIESKPAFNSTLASLRAYNVYSFRSAPLFQVLITRASAGILFFAVLNMAKKVPSFITGGTLWFTDLTTPDHRMCLPILLALTWWISIKLNPRNRLLNWAPKGKTGNMGVAMIGAAVAAGLPSAISCYVITSNLFSIAFAIVMMDPRVPKSLGILMKPPSTPKKIC